ncbi:MAG: Ig-like domain repeat protein [Candidatus Acidiferrales bacterium]
MLPLTAGAQSPPRSLVTRAIDESNEVTLRGTVHPLAQARFDQGAVSDSFAANRMLLILNRPPEREAALRQFLIDVHNPASTAYHKWVTPAQFGELFGPADSDIQTAVAWLASHGFHVPRISKSRTLIEFSGTGANVKGAFRTEIHQYKINGEIHYANATELTIPEALGRLVRGVSPINNFYPEAYVQSVGAASYSRATHKTTTLFTNPNGLTEYFAVAPEDFATQYDLGALYTAGVRGAGQVIGILNRSNIDVSLANAYRSLFNLQANPPQVVIDGDDPGEIADSVEAYLDVELSGAVAPTATVNLYIADGSNVQDPLALAALRAIEDNQASVLSASYGECEDLLGDTGNQLWAGLWEQAAAQGQTVFVSSGDSGPAACPLGLISTSGLIELIGLSVNGLASTPWNVAVGGTDFFYADYAQGAPSAPTFWNQTNDSGSGSLKAPLLEQPWGDALGLNAIPYLTFGDSIAVPSPAGGGGASNCTQSTETPPAAPVCTAGYPKPSWQNAPGVPSDKARDLPDVSLFAANGKNFSAYAICAQPGDCAGATGAQSTVFLVGGTSASSPAMAGIMALVNQRFGRQGQADFTLYALARQQPAIFHDITMGTNDSICLTGSPDCNTPLPDNVFLNLMSYGVYSAGPGYDEASGLGSVDANALVTNWNKTSFLPSSTALSLSPTSIVHGTPVTFTASVAPASGSGMPTGDVNISTTSPLALQKSGAVPLAGGTATEAVNFFPGGTYQVTAQYAGDGVFAPSTSAPASLTVTPEASAVAPIVHYTYVDATADVAHSGNVESGQQVPFGSQWTFKAEPSGASSQTTGLASGTVTFTDGPNSTPALIDSAGIAIASIASLAVGQHSVSVRYSGDASYNPSMGGPLNFAVVPGNPRIVLSLNPRPVDTGNPLVPTIPAGSSLTVGFLVGSGKGAAPTGNMTLTFGSVAKTVALGTILEEGLILGTAQATFADLQPGTYTLSASYAGDGNWAAARTQYPVPITVASENVVATTTALSVTPSSINSSGQVKLVVTVQAAAATMGAPFGIVNVNADGVGLGGGVLQATGPSSATAAITLAGTRLPTGLSQLTAAFSDPTLTFGPSTSAPVAVTVTETDFRLYFAQPQVVVMAGQSGSAALSLSGVNGAAVTVALSCAPSSSSITCSVNPSQPMVSNATSATLMINAYIIPQLGGNLLPRPPGGIENPGTLETGIATAFAFVIFLLRRRTARQFPAAMRWASGLCIFALLLFAAACGGGGGSSMGPPPPEKVPAPPGTYSVLVSATANGVAHNAKVIVVVQ